MKIKFLVFTILLMVGALSFQTPGESCVSSPLTGEMLSSMSQAEWARGVQILSGELPALVNGQSVTIETRRTSELFAGKQNALALPFLEQQLLSWLPPEHVELEDFRFTLDEGGGTRAGTNLIATLPGTLYPDEIILLIAHLDSTSHTGGKPAPGADDNASGSAGLLEAARILSGYQFERTIKLIWFTGEEQGLKGSLEYARQHRKDDIRAVINMDMIGYDGNNDGCFEIHAGRQPESQAVGQCVSSAISDYNLPLTFDFLTSQARLGWSDHSSFWEYSIPAVGLMENVSDNQPQLTCEGADFNPQYHSPDDRFEYLNLSTGFAIVQAGVAAVANLAGPLDACSINAPEIEVQRSRQEIRLEWHAVPGAEDYRIRRSNMSCAGPWENAQTSGGQTSWTDPQPANGSYRYYRIEAVSAGGSCSSAPSACAPVLPHSQ